MYKTVWDKIEAILNTIKVSSWIAYIYNYEPKMSWGYPYATITPWSSVENIYWSISQLAEVVYNISLYIRNESIAVQEAKIREIVDDILVALRWDMYLTWTAQKAIYEIERAYTNDQEPVRVAIIKCTYSLLIC
jgi:hypothetical protein